MPKLSFQYVRHTLTETLLEFLVRRFQYHGAAEWEERIHSGNVTVNGHGSRSGYLLKNRDKIIYEPPRVPEPPVDSRHKVLYEDETILAVDKSGNIPTSPSGKYWHHCLVHILKEERGLPELHAVHRLDRETSGINLFAKNKAAARNLGNDFFTGKIEKTYAAILRGKFPGFEALVVAPIGQDQHSEIRIRQTVTPEGRPAETAFKLINHWAETAGQPPASHVSIIPTTGRTHQIRLHAAYIGCPVWGDKLYGENAAPFIKWVTEGERNSTDRHLLHATSLRFTHPIEQREVIIESPEDAILTLYKSRGELTPLIQGNNGSLADGK